LADPLSHATQGALMLLAPFISRIRKKAVLLSLACMGGILGVLPDIIGLYGFVVRHDHGDLYYSAHHGAVKEMLQYIPMYSLHLGVDSLTHDPDRQWYGWNVRIWLQIVLWLVNGILICWFLGIWKQKRQLKSGKDSLSAQSQRTGAFTSNDP
jgi:hypothetical protein